MPAKCAPASVGTNVQTKGDVQVKHPVLRKGVCGVVRELGVCVECIRAKQRVVARQKRRGANAARRRVCKVAPLRSRRFRW